MRKSKIPLMSLETHPSYGKIETSFTHFEPFIKLGNVPDNIKNLYLGFLQELYVRTKDAWKPAACHSIPWLEQEANRIRLTNEHFKEVRVEPRAYMGELHYWLVTYLKGLPRELIIDPTGCPTPGQNYLVKPETITPFFGDKNLAIPHTARIYKAGEPTTYRRFQM